MRYRALLPLLPFVLLPATGLAQGLRISQVYGGGGNSGTFYKNDFIEIFNAGSSTVNLNGYSVQYNSAAGTGAWQATPLSGTIDPGKYYLIQEAAGTTTGGGTNPLPTPNATGSINMSATTGKVALMSTTTAIAAGNACPIGAVDFVAYGAAPPASGAVTCSEGSATGATPAPTIANATADFRSGGGCLDTDNNTNDFVATPAAPNPRNSTAATNPCLTISNVSLPEGNSGVTNFVFVASLNVAAAADVTFNAATADGTGNAATAPSDYTALPLTPFMITAGNLSVNITVGVNGDTTSEPDENFKLILSNVTGTLTGVLTAIGTIQNDDAVTITLSFSPTSLPTGSEGTNYSQTLTVNNASFCSFGTTGSLPPGIMLSFSGSNNTALLSGIPALSGSFSFTVSATCTEGSTSQQYTNVAIAFACEAGTKTSKPIHTIQGSGLTSPLVGQTVEIEGIVTGSFQGASAPEGYYVQEPDATWDALDSTSEGIYIFDPGTAPPAVGTRLRVKGTVSEFGTAGFTETELTSPTKLSCSTGNTFTRTNVTLPVAVAGDLERYEGMAVQFNQQLVVVANFNLAAFDELGLAPQVLYAPTQNPDRSTWAPNADLNARSMVYLNDASGIANANLFPTLFPPGGLSASNTIRVGARVNYNTQTQTVTPLQGILDQRNGQYDIETSVSPTFDNSSNPRPEAPVVGGRFKVASANVLNFFTTFPGAAGRGAANQTEFNNQRGKVLAELSGMSADIYGLSEVQNFDDGGTGTGSNHYTNNAVQSLTDGLNAIFGAGTYAFIDTLPLGSANGTDAIRCAIIYRVAAVTPVGSPAEFYENDTNRPTLAQTFQPATGAKASQQTFTVAVNHFRSKSSTCGNGQDDTFQGNCNGLRAIMATNVVAWLATNPTADPAPAGSRKILVIGDFNSYFGEDPIQYFAANGYPNLINLLIGPNAYSYNFGLQNGYLDHAMANSAMNSLVKNVAEWHINADEPSALEAENSSTKPATSNYVAQDQFAASDHDPILIGLNPLGGDFNDDGSVTTADQAMLQAAVGKLASQVDRRMDLDGDGKITLNDYRLWTNLYRAFIQ
jgi:predicted extracellular nuclease